MMSMVEKKLTCDLALVNFVPAFNFGGAWKLNKHVNLLFAGGRDIVGDTSVIAYIGLQFPRSERRFYLRSKNNPMMAKRTPTTRCHEAVS